MVVYYSFFSFLPWVGYCGADIKSICSEAALCALRRRYPQIYNTSEKLQLDLSSITISAKDFEVAMQKMIPASQRAVTSPGQALSTIVKPLLQNTVHMILEALQRVFPHAEIRTNKALDSGMKFDQLFEVNFHNHKAKCFIHLRNVSLYTS